MSNIPNRLKFEIEKGDREIEKKIVIRKTQYAIKTQIKIDSIGLHNIETCI